MTINWSAFVDLVNSHERFLLTSHIRPDGDALGSELGMAGVLETLGKQAMIVNGQATPANLAFIDPDRRIAVLGQDVQIDQLDAIEVVMVLDTSAWAQLGPMADVLRTTKAKKLVLDHHVSEDDLGAETFKNPWAEATGRLVAEAAEQLGVALTPAIATPLFVAIATDTGWYRFNSTTSATYRMAAKLIDAGAQPDVIFNSLYEQDTLARIKLRGRILARLATELEGRLAHTSVCREDFELAGAVPADTEDVVNMALAVAGTQAAVIFVEQSSGKVKVSFRSRCSVDCSELAGTFGGGGHKAAAGAMLDGPLEEAKRWVLDATRAAMQ